MFDHDLAAVYGTSTRRLNEQVRRNPERFPEDFGFPLSREEHRHLMSRYATSSHGGRLGAMAGGAYSFERARISSATAVP